MTSHTVKPSVESVGFFFLLCLQNNDNYKRFLVYPDFVYRTFNKTEEKNYVSKSMLCFRFTLEISIQEYIAFRCSKSNAHEKRTPNFSIKRENNVKKQQFSNERYICRQWEKEKNVKKKYGWWRTCKQLLCTCM